MDISVKDTLNTSGQYDPRVTGFMGGFVVFYLLLLLFKVMLLSPFNGECATWLIMCFQNGRFSDSSQGSQWSPGGRREGDSHRSAHRLRT